MWPNLQESPDLIIFTEEILTGKLDILCSGLTHMPLLEKSQTDFEGTKILIH